MESSQLKSKLSNSDEETSNKPKRMKLAIDNTLEEEWQFFRIFEHIFNTFIDEEKISEEQISNAISHIKNAFKNDIGNSFKYIHLNQPDILCGYLYRYGPHGAGLARNSVLKAIQNCNILKNKLREDTLSVVSLGGGPGNDLIGFCSALYENDLGSNLKLTVVDRVKEWSRCVKLAESLIHKGNYGNVSKLFQQYTVNMSFSCMEVPKPKNRLYYQIICGADIIIMSKLLSIMKSDDREELILSLFDGMKPDALLIFIDSPFQPDMWVNFDILYRSECGTYSKSKVTQRFGHYDSVTSKARIAVMRKKQVEDAL